MFRRIDDDGSKTICYPEFKKGIHDSGLVMEEEGYQVGGGGRGGGGGGGGGGRFIQS